MVEKEVHIGIKQKTVAELLETNANLLEITTLLG